MPELEAFHEPYLAVNREITGLLDAGELARAQDVLLDYFDRAERQLLAAFAEMDAPGDRQRAARVGR